MLCHRQCSFSVFIVLVILPSLVVFEVHVILVVFAIIVVLAHAIL